MITETELLDELRGSLARGDLVKARVVVGSLAGQRPELQRTVLEQLDRCAAVLAIPLLGTLLDQRIGDLSISRTEIAEVAAAKALQTPSLLQTVSNDACIQIVTVLGDSGDERALRCLRRLLISEPASANLRFTIYDALGKLPLRAGGYILAAGLEDPELSVRVAAARAIEKNLDDTLRQGLINLLHEAEPAGTRLVTAVAQAGAMQVIEALLADDQFTRLLADHLERAPDSDFIERLRPLLERQGRAALLALVDRYLASVDEEGHPLIYAVDDSMTVLRMYRAALAATGCVVRVFENPFEAVERAIKSPPDLLFTDLNMPEINGIELASTLRSNAQIADFPIVMVTTQGQGVDIDLALNSGIDAFIQKPFSARQLIEVINALTDDQV